MGHRKSLWIVVRKTRKKISFRVFRGSHGVRVQWLRPWRSERLEPESLRPLLWELDEPLLAGAECGTDCGAACVEVAGAACCCGAE